MSHTDVMKYPVRLDKKPRDMPEQWYLTLWDENGLANHIAVVIDLYLYCK